MTRQVADVGPHHLSAQSFEIRIGLSSQAPHLEAARQQLFDDIASKEPAGAGDKSFHLAGSVAVNP